MKKIATMILFSIITMTLLSCNNATDVDKKVENEKNQFIRIWCAEGYIEEWDENLGETLCYMEYPYFCLYPEDAEKFPELQETLMHLCESKREERYEEFEESAESLHEFYAEDPDYYYGAYYSIEEAMIRRADSKVISISFYSGDYWGGAHGTHRYWGENYDAKTGKKLTLSDVVMDKKQLADAVGQKLDKYYGELVCSSEIDLEKLIQEENEISWTIDYNGLTVYFNPYVIAYSGTVPQIVTISPEESPGIIKEEYCSGFDSYCMKLDGAIYYDDVTGDGVSDKLECSIHEYDGVKRFQIWIDGECHYDEEIICSDSQISLVHLENNQNFVCVEAWKDKDMCETMFIKLDEHIEKIGSIGEPMNSIKYQNGELWKTYDVMANPGEIYMDGKLLDIILKDLSD